MPAPTKHIITYNVSIQVPGGPRPPLSGSLTVDALLDYKVEVKKGDKNVVADIQPGAADTVQFFQMMPDKENSALRFKLSADGAWFQVGQLILLVGQGATGAMGGIPDRIWFSNDGESDATVAILVGRDVVRSAAVGGAAGDDSDDADDDDDSSDGDDGDGDTGDGDTGDGGGAYDEATTAPPAPDVIEAYTEPAPAAAPRATGTAQSSRGER